jgi:hypothetical protein
MSESHPESQDSCLPRHGRPRVERTWSWKARAYCRWLQAFLNFRPGFLDFVRFTDEARFHRQTSSYGAFSKAVCMDIGREHSRTCETTSRVRFKPSHRRLSIVCKHAWEPNVDTFSICCDDHVFNMKQGTCVTNFILLNVLVGKLYRQFQVRKLVGHPIIWLANLLGTDQSTDGITTYLCEVSKSKVFLVLNLASTMLRRRMGKWRYSFTIINLGTRWRWVVSFTHLSFSLRGNSPINHCIEGRVGPRHGLGTI